MFYGWAGALRERDTGVEPVSQPWEGWAQPIYQSRNTQNGSDPAREMQRSGAGFQGQGDAMNDDELAFYDALGVNDSAVQVLGNETLRKIALELTQMIRKSVTIDWTQRDSVQAELRLKVKKILRKYGYPPDKQEKATQTVLEQAGLIAKDWVAA